MRNCSEDGATGFVATYLAGVTGTLVACRDLGAEGLVALFPSTGAMPRQSPTSSSTPRWRPLANRP